MISLIRTDSKDKDFVELVKLLDADLAERDGTEHAFYTQFNKIDKIKYVVLAHRNGKAVGCGAIKEFNQTSMEIKRMFTSPSSRGLGVAARVIQELEAWASEMNYERCILETGINQPEAISLYAKLGYKRISNYGQYYGVENSLCFEKRLNSSE